jgi:hypothetical protein
MKMTLKNRTALVALLFALALPLVQNVHASGPFATNYSNASLTGVYGYSSDGWHLGASNPSNSTTNVPLDSAGVMWFDGNGTFKFHDTADLGGFVIQRGTADNPIVGTYTVNPDGTGTMQWFSNGSNHTRAFAIVDGGMELQFGAADGLDTSRGVAKKQ